jgi:hypothetical protein
MTVTRDWHMPHLSSIIRPVLIEREQPRANPPSSFFDVVRVSKTRKLAGVAPPRRAKSPKRVLAGAQRPQSTDINLLNERILLRRFFM